MPLFSPCNFDDVILFFSEMHKYGDFYRFSDVRPPFTYAALIRQVHRRFVYVIMAYYCHRYLHCDINVVSQLVLISVIEMVVILML